MMRPVPHSRQAEQAVLGGLMLAPESWLVVCDMLRAEDFYGRDHALIWEAIRSLAEANPPKPFDAVTLGEWFEAQGKGEMVEGGAYLIELASTTPSAANIRAYAEIVRDHAGRRQLIEVGTLAVNAGFDPAGRDLSEIVTAATNGMAQIAGARKTAQARSMREIGLAWFENLRRMSENPGNAHGLLTPWSGLNKITNGFYDGDLVILAGRPGMGKSAAALGVAMSASLRGERGMMFALEMTDVSLFNRAAASLADVPLEWLRRPEPTDESECYWPRLSDAVRVLRDAPFVIDSTPGLSWPSIEARAKREHQRNPLRFVVIDHMHLVSLPKRENGATEYGDVSHAAKNLAKTLGCPVILLAQLNRGVEARANKRPVMSDLRESGAIEQDADTVILLYRDDYYAELEGRPSTAQGVIELIVGKQREGRPGTAYALAELGMGRIGDTPDGFHIPQRVEAAPAKRTWGSRGADRAAGNA